jgi:mono/diheme cytochrome c family protein
MRSILLLIFLTTSSLAQQSLEDSYERGQMIYADFCLRCHLPDGTGESGVIPPLAKADFLQDVKATVHSIKYGIHGPITVNGVKYNGSMAPMGLENDEIADVTNYILNSWGNKSDEIVTVAYVHEIKETK